MRTVRKAPGFVGRAIGDETIVVPVSDGVGNLEAIFTLNPVGAAIWAGIDGRATVDDLSAALVRDFAVDPVVAVQDVAEFVDLLVAKGLVVPAEAAAP
jgi:hypothetical protein